MQNHEHDHEAQPDEGSRLSQLLAAHLLGEATPEESAEVERALEASAELRQERDRFQATIGLVQDLGDASAPEHLSPAASERLAAAAQAHGADSAGGGSVLPFERPAPTAAPSWARSPNLRLAASFALLVGALAAWKLGGGGMPLPATQFEAASAEAPESSPAASPVTNEVAGRAPAGKRVAAEEQALTPELTDSLRKVGYISEGASRAKTATVEDLRVLGYGDGADTEASYDADASAMQALADNARGRQGETALLSDSPLASQEPTLLDFETVSAVPEEVFEEPAPMGGTRIEEAEGAVDSFALGLSQGTEPSKERASLGALLGQADSGPSSPGPAAPASKGLYKGPSTGNLPSRTVPDSSGTYKGPGDTTPPGGGAANTRQDFRFAGRASEKKAKDETPLFFDDTNAGEEDPMLRASLEALGYVEADEDGEVAFRSFEAPEQATLERLRGLGYVGDESSVELAEIDARIAEIKQSMQGIRPAHSTYLRVQNEVQRLEELRRVVEADRFEGGRKARAVLQELDRSRRVEALLASCRRRPNEKPRDMFYRWWGDNAFEVTRQDALSTFSIDVDTASYTLARRYLVDGKLPEKAQIRTEEFLNYFKADVPAPQEMTFAVATELAPSRFNASPDTWMMRVAVRGKEVAKEERLPLSLTFVVDVSGSMKEERRLELVKHALRLLVGELDARDSIAIVAFTNDSRLILPLTSARHRGLIESAIHPLAPEGGTNLEAGLRMGYEVALTGRSREAINRVVLLSDGVGNIGETDAQRLTDSVAHARDRGVLLNTIGVGMDNHNDALLEQLADKGDGLCNYVDDEKEARRALVENFTGAFQPIARDVKIQVEFDPGQVARYRLLGYENRALADADFRNDAVDAGEVGSGHQVVALYELERTGNGDPAGPMATVRVRWLPPSGAMLSNQVVLQDEGAPAFELEHPVQAREATGAYDQASAGYRRSVLVAQLAEFLRRSVHARQDSFSELLDETRKLQAELSEPDFDEFVQMVERTIELGASQWGRTDDLARRLDALRMQRYLKAQLEELGRELDRARLEEIEGDCQTLENEIRDLLGSATDSTLLRSIGYTDGPDEDR